MRRKRTMRVLSKHNNSVCFTKTNSKPHPGRRAAASNSPPSSETDRQVRRSPQNNDGAPGSQTFAPVLLRRPRGPTSLKEINALHPTVRLPPSFRSSLHSLFNSALLSPCEDVNASRADGWREHLITLTPCLCDRK